MRELFRGFDQVFYKSRTDGAIVPVRVVLQPVIGCSFVVLGVD